MIYKNKKILFIILFILLLFAILVIALLNYFVDPYNVIHKSARPFKMYNYPSDMYSTAIKLSKDEKYEYLVMGSPGTRWFYDSHIFDSSKVIFAVADHVDIAVELSYLKLILKVHPEIKTIIFPMEYIVYYINYEPIPQVKDDIRLTTKELIRLFFHIDATKDSIKKIKNSRKNISKYIDLNSKSKSGNNDVFKIKQITLHQFYRRNYSDFLYQNFKNEKYEYLKEIKNIIGDREIIFIFPPYHAIAQSALYIDNNYSPVEKIKQIIVENYPDSDIYDYAYINKYTTETIDTTNNYFDIINPIGTYGTFYYCTLKYPEKFKNKDAYIKLDKDNIEETLKWQRERLKDYSEKNSTYIKDFMKTNKLDNEKYFKETIYNLPENCQWYVDNL